MPLTSTTFLRAITGAHGPANNPHFPKETARQLAADIRRDTDAFLADRRNHSARRSTAIDEMVDLV